MIATDRRSEIKQAAQTLWNENSVNNMKNVIATKGTATEMSRHEV